MAVNKITSDYTGRKKDISILQYPDPHIADAQSVKLNFSKNGRFCTGVQKTIQKYTVLLLTNLGSQEKFPEFGTSFYSDLIYRSGALDTILATQIFVAASAQAVDVIKAYQIYKDDIPADERLVSATLEDIVINNVYIAGRPDRQVAFSVKILTEAGESVDYVLPLPK